MQLDKALRGFSFKKDGPLDMRMSRNGPTASDFINKADENLISEVIFKYGEEKRFKTILNTLPLPYLKISPEEKYLSPNNNPPDVKVTFLKDGPDIKNINCYSNEEDKWRNSKIDFISDNEIKINLEGKFVTERGRINCSLRENTGEWRWLGIQFVISDL